MSTALVIQTAFPFVFRSIASLSQSTAPSQLARSKPNAKQTQYGCEQIIERVRLKQYDNLLEIGFRAHPSGYFKTMASVYV